MADVSLDNIDLGQLLRDGLMVNDGEIVSRPPRPRSPVPQWLLDQQRATRSGSGANHPEDQPWMTDQGSDVGPVVRIMSDLTGAPSVYRGISKLKDEDTRVLHKGAGALEAAIGAAPIAGQVARPAASAISWATQTLPRLLMTMGAPTLTAVADREGLDKSIKTAMFGEPAQAQSAQKEWKPPTAEEKKSRAWVMGEQDRLIKGGYYSKDAPGYGSYGHGTEAALKREWEDKQKAASAERAAATKADREFQLQQEANEIKKKELAGSAAAQKATDTAAADAKERKRLADIERGAISNEDANSPWTKFGHNIAPYLAAIPGIIAGGFLAHKIGGRVEAGRQKSTTEAEELLKLGKNPNFGDKVGAVNSFYTHPGAQPSMVPPWLPRALGGGGPEGAFLRTGSKSPYWKPNPDAPQSAALYPESKGYVVNMGGPALLGTAEMAGGHFGSKWQEGKKAEAEAAMADPNASAADVRAAAERRDTAANVQAAFDTLENFGRGTAGGGGVKGLVQARTQPPMRPSNIGTVDKLTDDIMKELAKRKAATAKNAKATPARQARTAPTPGGRPNGSGGGAAPLIPLAAGSLLQGPSGRQEDAQGGSEPQYTPHWQMQHRDEAGRFGPKKEGSAARESVKGENSSSYPLTDNEGALGRYLREGGFY